VPFELPVYAMLGALVGWLAFRTVLAISARGQRRQ
jgi:hypothetical protein